jgi:[DsrC]-trisulfide reductase subunit J
VRDRIVILAGLAAFFGLITYPIWYDHAARTTSSPPVLKLPATEKQCVAPVSYMRSSHMQLLIRWREEAVRQNVRTYTAFNGKVYQVSLTGTCLHCHNKRDFCDRCHNYAVVEPVCWDCHLDPSEVQKAKGTEYAHR